MNALFIIVTILLLLTSVRLWIRAARRVFSGTPILRHEPRQQVPWGLADVLVALFIQMLALQVAGALLGPNADPLGELDELDAESRANVLLAAGMSSLFALVLTIGWLMHRHRTTASDLGFDVRRIGSDIWLGIRAFIMLAPLVYGVQRVLVEFIDSAHPLIELVKENPSPRFFLVSGIAAVVVAPIVEEFLFRLLVQGWFERLAEGGDDLWRAIFGRPGIPTTLPTATNETDAPTQPAASGFAPELLPESSKSVSYESTETFADRSRRRVAIVASAMLFALPHVSHGPDPIPLFILALGLGYLYQSTHRIIPCITVHLLLNFFSLAMLWMLTFEPVAK